MVFTVSLLGAHHTKGSVGNKPATSIVVGWFWLHIHWEISLHTDLKKQIKRCIYSLAPCLCNAITLAASAFTIHKVGVGRPLSTRPVKQRNTSSVEVLELLRVHC